MSKEDKNVLHKVDEGQNRGKAGRKMSFIRSMKDKTEVKQEENVLHKADEGQNGGKPGRKCPS